MSRLVILFLTLSIILVACKKDDPKITFEDLPQGDAARGAAIFENGKNNATACKTCHNITDVKQTGPGMAGFGERAGERVDGESAAEYAYHSILRPSRYVVTGFSNVMPSDYEEKFTAQDIADLITYLLTL
jgi:cytochrome c553